MHKSVSSHLRFDDVLRQPATGAPYERLQRAMGVLGEIPLYSRTFRLLRQHRIEPSDVRSAKDLGVRVALASAERYDPSKRRIEVLNRTDARSFFHEFVHAWYDMSESPLAELLSDAPIDGLAQGERNAIVEYLAAHHEQRFSMRVAANRAFHLRLPQLDPHLAPHNEARLRAEYAETLSNTYKPSSRP